MAFDQFEGDFCTKMQLSRRTWADEGGDFDPDHIEDSLVLRQVEDNIALTCSPSL